MLIIISIKVMRMILILVMTMILTMIVKEIVIMVIVINNVTFEQKIVCIVP